MTLKDFRELLEQNPEKNLVFYLPNGNPVPRHFHITEAGHVRKRFIDCGGGRHDVEACQLQAWVANDVDHLLEAGKLARILDLSSALFPSQELPMELEYEDGLLSQYRVASSEMTPRSLLFFLETKHADCLAKSACGLEESSCAPGSGCC